MCVTDDLTNDWRFFYSDRKVAWCCPAELTGIYPASPEGSRKIARGGTRNERNPRDSQPIIFRPGRRRGKDRQRDRERAVRAPPPGRPGYLLSFPGVPLCSAPGLISDGPSALTMSALASPAGTGPGIVPR